MPDDEVSDDITPLVGGPVNEVAIKEPTIVELHTILGSSLVCLINISVDIKGETVNVMIDSGVQLNFIHG